MIERNETVKMISDFVEEHWDKIIRITSYEINRSYDLDEFQFVLTAPPTQSRDRPRTFEFWRKSEKEKIYVSINERGTLTVIENLVTTVFSDWMGGLRIQQEVEGQKTKIITPEEEGFKEETKKIFEKSGLEEFIRAIKATFK